MPHIHTTIDANHPAIQAIETEDETLSVTLARMLDEHVQKSDDLGVEPFCAANRVALHLKVEPETKKWLQTMSGMGVSGMSCILQMLESK